jgi:hypothetical protein
VLLGHSFQRGGKAKAYVRKQDIEAPVPASDLLENTIRLTEGLQVGAQREYLASDLACRSIQVPLIGAGDNDLRTSAANSFAASSPIPEVPPVMRATLFERFIVLLLVRMFASQPEPAFRGWYMSVDRRVTTEMICATEIEISVASSTRTPNRLNVMRAFEAAARYLTYVDADGAAVSIEISDGVLSASSAIFRPSTDAAGPDARTGRRLRPGAGGGPPGLPTSNSASASVNGHFWPGCRRPIAPPSQPR